MLKFDEKFQGFIFEDINPAIRLPKGFGVYVESDLPSFLCVNYTTKVDKSGLITYLKVISVKHFEYNPNSFQSQSTVAELILI